MKKKDRIIFRVFSTFTMDVISKCAFGMQIDNLGEKDDPFMKNAQTVFNPPVNKTPLIVIPCNHRIVSYSRLFYSKFHLVEQLHSRN